MKTVTVYGPHYPIQVDVEVNEEPMIKDGTSIESVAASMLAKESSTINPVGPGSLIELPLVKSYYEVTVETEIFTNSLKGLTEMEKEGKLLSKHIRMLPLVLLRRIWEGLDLLDQKASLLVSQGRIGVEFYYPLDICNSAAIPGAQMAFFVISDAMVAKPKKRWVYMIR